MGDKLAPEYATGCEFGTHVNKLMQKDELRSANVGVNSWIITYIRNGVSFFTAQAKFSECG